jgi:hypothetical protein
MPFFDNSGIDWEEPRGPVASAFATLRDQLERWIVLNLLWAGQSLPLILAWIFPGWPISLRLGLVVAGALALAIGTGVLYRVAGAAVRGEPLDFGLVWGEVNTHWLHTLTGLLPLYSWFGLLWLGSQWAMAQAFYWPEVLLRLLLGLSLFCGLYWGPLWAEQPASPVRTLALGALRLAWRNPGPTLRVLIVIAVTALIGVVSIGGLFLAVPILIVLLQTHLYQTIVSHRKAT